MFLQTYVCSCANLHMFLQTAKKAHCCPTKVRMPEHNTTLYHAMTTIAAIQMMIAKLRLEFLLYRHDGERHLCLKLQSHDPRTLQGLCSASFKYPSKPLACDRSPTSRASSFITVNCTQHGILSGTLPAQSRAQSRASPAKQVYPAQFRCPEPPHF
jgi:hypothetical protein